MEWVYSEAFKTLDLILIDILYLIWILRFKGLSTNLL